jgi:TonB family protein
MTQENKDYYKILQVDSSADSDIVTVAYKRLARKYHPDTNRSPNATLRMQEINAAYQVLRDPVKRAQYDRERTSSAFRSQAREEEEHRTEEEAVRRHAEAAQRRTEEKQHKPPPAPRHQWQTLGWALLLGVLITIRLISTQTTSIPESPPQTPVRNADIQPLIQTFEIPHAVEDLAGRLSSIRLRNYQAELMAKITDAWKIPPQSQGLQASVFLLVNRAGQVEQVHFVHGSGNTLFDDSLQRAVTQAQPLAALPEDYTGRAIEVTLHFRDTEQKIPTNSTTTTKAAPYKPSTKQNNVNVQRDTVPTFTPVDNMPRGRQNNRSLQSDTALSQQTQTVPSPSRQVALSYEENESIELACFLAKSQGPATYNECRSSQIAMLAHAPQRPNLSQLSDDERESLELACFRAKSHGPMTYAQCLSAQISQLSATPRRPNLSGLTPDEHESIELACFLSKSRGPASYNSCLQTQLSKLGGR